MLITVVARTASTAYRSILLIHFCTIKQYVSFRLHEDDEMAAKVGVEETTTEPNGYAHPTNPKIQFCDLPGVGTPNYPKDTYWKKVGMERYDIFLIFSQCRFTENDLELARKIRSKDKRFFFIRTRIDIDIENEKRKKLFNKGTVLQKIRRNCFWNLKGLLESSNDIFLINNHDSTKWDFVRLTQAILDVLRAHQRERLTPILNIVTSMSSDILQRKVKVLKGRIWKLAAASAAVAVVPIPCLSFAVDLALIKGEISFYRSQLGLPEADSAEFSMLNVDMQNRVRKFCFTSAAQIFVFLSCYASQSAVEEASRYIPIVGLAIAGSMSFASTYYLLHRCLAELEKTAIEVIEDFKQRALNDDLELV